MNIQGFDFSNEFKCSDVHKFEKPNNLSIKIFELSFYQDRNNWKHKLISLEISKTNSFRVIDFLIYKNHIVLIKKFRTFSGSHSCIAVCRRYLSSDSGENVLFKHKQRCDQQEITCI